MTIHNFNDSLEWSERFETAPWWEEVYRKAFPDFVGMHYIRGAGWGQTSGVDRVVVFNSSRTVTADEKVRKEDYGDVLLEYWSIVPKDGGKRVPGWACKPLNCDFIAYAIVPTRTCYLLPLLTLQRAFRQYGPEWRDRARAGQDGFRLVKADNRWYMTHSLAVPIPVLMPAMGDAMTVTWTAET